MWAYTMLVDAVIAMQVACHITKHSLAQEQASYKAYTSYRS